METRLLNTLKESLETELDRLEEQQEQHKRVDNALTALEELEETEIINAAINELESIWEIDFQKKIDMLLLTRENLKCLIALYQK